MKTNGRVLKNVLCTSVRGCPQVDLKTRKCESEDPPTLKTLLEKLLSVKVALVGVDLAIAHYKGEGEVELIEPPAILDDPEFFEESGETSKD